MKRILRGFPAALCAALALQLSPARGQSPSAGAAAPPAATSAATAQPAAKSATAAAQALFLRASQKLDQRDFAAACPMLEEVLRLEPGANGARLALAECYEESGRLASAHRTYAAAADTAGRLGQTERQKAAEARARDLRARAGAVIVQVPPAVRALAGLAITACGALLAEAQHGTPRLADEGTCTISVVAAGKQPWERTVEVKDGATTSVTVDALADAPRPPPPPEPAPPPPPPSPRGQGNAPPADRPPADRPPAPPPGLSHRGQLGAWVRVDIDVLSAGAVTALGLSYGVWDHVELSLSGLVGKRAGFEAGVTGYFLTGAVKPLVQVSAPVLFEGGAHVGIRGAAGVQWDILRHVGVFAVLGAAYFPEVPPRYSHAAVLPALGVQGRL